MNCNRDMGINYVRTRKNHACYGMGIGIMVLDDAYPRFQLGHAPGLRLLRGGAQGLLRPRVMKGSQMETTSKSRTDGNVGRKQSDIRKERTRAKILAAARTLFAQKGYEATNIVDIAKKIKMAHGTIYHHFPDKKSILVELTGEFFGKVKAMAGKWAETSDVNREIEERFVRDAAMLLYDNCDLARIVMKESYYEDPQVLGLINETYEYLREKAAGALELGMALGVVRPMNSRIAAVAIIGMIKEVVFYFLETGEDMDLDPIIDEVSRLHYYGIRP